MLKFVKQLDTTEYRYMDQFIIMGKNSCLVQKNGELKTRLFKSLGVYINKTQYNHYDLFVSVMYNNDERDIVCEIGLDVEDLGKLLVEISRHGSIAPMPL